MISDLIRLSNHFDKNNLIAEANYLDEVIRKIAIAAEVEQTLDEELDQRMGEINELISAGLSNETKELILETLKDLLLTIQVDEGIGDFFDDEKKYESMSFDKAAKKKPSKKPSKKQLDALDKNKNGEIDSEDFKLLRKKKK